MSNWNLTDEMQEIFLYGAFFVRQICLGCRSSSYVLAVDTLHAHGAEWQNKNIGYLYLVL